MTALAKKQLSYYLGTAGFVGRVGDGVARVEGLQSGAVGERIRFKRGVYGMVYLVEESSLSAIVLGSDSLVQRGDPVWRTGTLMSVPVGAGLIGRTVNALGEPIDGAGKIKSQDRGSIEVKAPGVIERESVSETMFTGMTIVDAVLPIGRGQRELIIGDRGIGKTAIGIDMIIAQRMLYRRNDKVSNVVYDPVICVYVGIGQKCSSIARIVELLKEQGAMSYTVVVSSAAADPVSLRYLAPYAGATIGEWFRDRGMHVLIIYDDLSKHAVAYREMSLLLGRSPAREAYPGDVFYLHSRLLERAAKLSRKLGGGSMTAMPVVETQAGDVSAYIPTNVISITDGQIYLDEKLFQRGVRPAVDTGLSVSRVGAAAQGKTMKGVASKLKLELAQYREVEGFKQFGADLDDASRRMLERGERLVEVLVQSRCAPLVEEKQLLGIFAGIGGCLSEVGVKEIKLYLRGLFDFSDIEELFAPWIECLRNAMDVDVKTVVDFLLDFYTREFKVKNDWYVREYVLNKGYSKDEMKWEHTIRDEIIRSLELEPVATRL